MIIEDNEFESTSLFKEDVLKELPNIEKFMLVKLCRYYDSDIRDKIDEHLLNELFLNKEEMKVILNIINKTA